MRSNAAAAIRTRRLWDGYCRAPVSPDPAVIWSRNPEGRGPRDASRASSLSRASRNGSESLELRTRLAKARTNSGICSGEGRGRLILLTALSCRGAKFSTRLGSALEGERQPETPPGQMAGANADRLVAKRVDGCARRSELSRSVRSLVNRPARRAPSFANPRVAWPPRTGRR